MEDLVKVGTLPVGSKFTTTLTGRMGIVLNTQDPTGPSIAVKVLFASGSPREKDIHPDVRVRV
jgi:hypothetical protein